MRSCFLHRVVSIDRWYPQVNKSGIPIQYTCFGIASMDSP